MSCKKCTPKIREKERYIFLAQLELSEASLWTPNIFLTFLLELKPLSTNLRQLTSHRLEVLQSKSNTPDPAYEIEVCCWK